MCKPTTAPSRAPPRKKHSVLLTTESFGPANAHEEHEKKYDGAAPDQADLAPTVVSTMLTIGVVVIILLGIEHGLRYVFDQYKDFHPLFEVEHNRHILARHIGVDAVACLAVAFIGLKHSHLLDDLKHHTLGRSDSMPEDGYNKRMFTYHPAAQQVLLLFFAYQVKNTYDSYVWNDGIIFILHHLLSGVTAWGGMYPGCAHFYVIFFMGISEVSTAILCLLANFDDEFGVTGLGDAFPITKVALGGVFAVAFILCRTVIWPICTYHFLRDSKNALKSDSPLAQARKKWIRLFMFCCVGLSILQVIWLGQIVWTIKEEVEKLM